ncbi:MULTISPECIES: hypothetical protein [Nostocales]|jgi:hypothetical protein|uniref:DUF6414 family protein n=1 Tax=Nostocales TaxID=1161 RepID=UPI00029B5CE4|nr:MULTISPECIES: hypothetical protein [Nostocales]MBO1052171.1 hypothetical protein [Dolichospermum sp. DET73]AFW93385.1 hypothetical protein ANA_C10586 [Anabaena sp. 90]MTJ16597.1 hypothetical protein [Dolichospermum sp. UHCC 0299]MTJ23644.1 hypothetical protein [Dolichospermum sp. UHCC 0352]MTJ40197.1 hypothetical protein [Dolichospermum sp. UHCC 0406]
MQEDLELKENLIEEDEILSLKHFIYLDKIKLHSYSSQLFGGLVQLRRLTENEGTKSTQSSGEEYKERIQEDGKEGEISIGPKNYAGGASGKTVDKTTQKDGYKKGVNTTSDEYLYSTTEDIVEHDYGYLTFEEILINKGILKEIKDIEELEKYSSLIKITGVCRFIDWDSIIELFSHDNVINLFLPNSDQNSKKGFKQNTQQKKEEENHLKTTKAGLEIIKAFSIGSVTVNTNIGNSNLIGTINQEHLRITRDQLRSAYIMPGDVEMTIVGFIPRRGIEKITFPGLSGLIDMTEVWKAWTGEIDLVIEPIAIYTEIK